MRVNNKRTTALLKTFGNVVRSQRQLLGLSQEPLAETADFDRTYISLLERGLRNPSLTNLCRLAAALSIKPSDLLKGIIYGP